MGLATNQIRLLSLTARKSDCEYGLSIKSMEKMALTREMSELSQEYYSRLQAKKISYYSNGKYNKINYNYLMGGTNYQNIINGSDAIKTNNSMILTDYKGRVVLSTAYANAITSVCGTDLMDEYGRGGTFDKSYIPQILQKITTNAFSAEQFKAVMNGDDVTVDEDLKTKVYNALNYKAAGGDFTWGSYTNEEYVDKAKGLIQQLLDFYLPILNAAATNGWTTEYNEEMAANDDYISDALISGSMHLTTVGETGYYEEESESLTYFITAGYVEARTDSDIREEITAWYNAEKEKISEKENYIDVTMDNLSTELESINTEIQAIQTLIDDAVSSVFDWGTG